MTEPDPTRDARFEEKREALREKLMNEAPSWYNPWLHLIIPSLFGASAIAGALSTLSNVTVPELLSVPGFYLFANAVEWWAHKYLLHHRNPLAPVLYDRHTPEHHMVYTTHRMDIRDVREFRLVLIPAYGVMLIFLAILPLAYGLARLGYPNLGALYLATAMAYAVSYEWLHLSYHLGPETFVGRLGLIRRLKRHHATHHDIRVMGRLNFNVTIPIWDHILGTVARPEDGA